MRGGGDGVNSNDSTNSVDFFTYYCSMQGKYSNYNTQENCGEECHYKRKYTDREGIHVERLKRKWKALRMLLIQYIGIFMLKYEISLSLN